MATLNPEQIEEALALISQGYPIPAVAEKFGVTRQAFYMRRRRDPDFDIRVMQAEATAHMHFWDKLRDALEKGNKAWTGWSCILQRRFGFVDELDAAKVREINDKAADTLEQQKRLREFVESARYESHGSATATPEQLEGEAP